MLAYSETTLGCRDLLRRTVHETQADNGFGLAAQLAYYFFLSLFPALLFLLALASLIFGFDFVGRTTAALAGIAPAEVLDVIREQLTKMSEGSHGALLSFGVAAALWSSSSAMVALIDALDAAYDVRDARPSWKQRRDHEERDSESQKNCGRKAIGARAARKFREQRRETIQPIPVAPPPHRMPPAVTVGRTGALIAAITASLFGRRTKE